MARYLILGLQVARHLLKLAFSNRRSKWYIGQTIHEDEDVQTLSGPLSEMTNLISDCQNPETCIAGLPEQLVQYPFEDGVSKDIVMKNDDADGHSIDTPPDSTLMDELSCSADVPEDEVSTHIPLEHTPANISCLPDDVSDDDLSNYTPLEPSIIGDLCRRMAALSLEHDEDMDHLAELMMRLKLDDDDTMMEEPSAYDLDSTLVDCRDVTQKAAPPTKAERSSLFLTVDLGLCAADQPTEDMLVKDSDSLISHTPLLVSEA
ncbi:hypothetical protein WOLCODRAFT_162723 [Wolfiporia cocos MD-104 SS10]|uniref:Uncharacterized protein n=1 Tax=Wolfiporia cocos (strain MD-104) TaxID=742152 RepID=A0A2H3JW91_WOLCO|nr:hypothetical protein WOLCODRAFT_162723 [Wolfiporia cocos MD-104 SS10]